jgi:hypothetical protein
MNADVSEQVQVSQVLVITRDEFRRSQDHFQRLIRKGKQVAVRDEHGKIFLLFGRGRLSREDVEATRRSLRALDNAVAAVELDTSKPDMSWLQ